MAQTSICSLCKCIISEAPGFEVWRGPESQKIALPKSIASSATVDSSVGEIEICRKCYEGELPGYLNQEDLAEIHFQFSLEFNQARQLDLAVQAAVKAVSLHPTADHLAQLAYALSSVGRTEEAQDFYSKALAVDPSHFQSLENLRHL